MSNWNYEDPRDTDNDIHLDADENSDTSVVRITTHKVTNIRVTPLILPVIDKLLTNIKDNVRAIDGAVLHAHIFVRL